MNKIILTLAEDATITRTYAPHIANNSVNLIEIVAPISKIKTQSGTVSFPGSLTVKLCVAVGGNTIVEQTLTWSGTAPYIASVPMSPALCAVSDVKVYLKIADSSTNEVPLRFDASETWSSITCPLKDLEARVTALEAVDTILSNALNGVSE